MMQAGFWPKLNPGRWVEIALLALLVVQCVRLAWTLVTPVGAFGGWVQRLPAVPGVAARRALLTGFDPFFRTAPVDGGGANVTSLALRLYGIRLNEGSGGGSAIIAGADGVQNSYAVGEDIMPGVKLTGVAFDHVTISRGGVEESLFIDQSTPAPPAPGMVQAAPGAPPASGGLNPARINAELAFTPRTQGARITGIGVGPRSGTGFTEAGFQPGDVIVQVNGRPVTTPEDLSALQASVTPGARLVMMVERGGATVPVTIQVAP